MKWWDRMPWSSFPECWALSQLFCSPLSLSSRGFLVPLHFMPEGWCQLHIWGYWYFSWKTSVVSNYVRPTDSSPPGTPVPGILQAKILEWVAISFSNAWRWKVKVKLLSHIGVFVTPCTVAYQVPPSMGFSRQECWNGFPLPFLRLEVETVEIRFSVPFISRTRPSWQEYICMSSR